MIDNRYRGIPGALKHFLQERYPYLYVRGVMPLLFAIADRMRAPVTRRIVETLMEIRPFPLFHHIEIETINRCNAACSFCPVSRGHDERTYRLMDQELFVSIVGQLKELAYCGSVGLFSNNEPLLDKRIVDFARLAKESLPGAHIFLMTNGLLLTTDLLDSLMPHLDELHIDNYDDRLMLTEPAEKIRAYCVERDSYRDKVRISLRKNTEVLTSKGGQAPNKRRSPIPIRSSCLLPFKQLVVRPDGKISLCCNDAYGKTTMGDLTKDRIVDAWNGEAFWTARRLLARGRRNIPICAGCDSAL
ncbi:MAG: radical SAM protein [Elusimicrobiota bacterium]